MSTNNNSNNNTNETSNSTLRNQPPVSLSNPPNRPNLASLISAHIQASTSIMPLSSSLPGSIASSLNINSANATSLQQSLVGSDCKMDTSGPISTASTAIFIGDVISRLYPNVNQQETPLPRQWSVVHKQNTLKLSMSNLRVTYTGPGKTHKDAAAIRTDHVIPPACGIYYYEIKIISKGRDGYMGIGLSKADVQLCRLPGWDKNSYGYHGDDGHSFCCSGTGQNYGPTFTTGDVIGCCLNLIDNTCFYTKNGYHLGVAFRDLPGDLYPTVGLQTPSESVEANFGQYPFEFDILNYVKEWHAKTRQTIESFPLKKEVENSLPNISRKLISTYLVHQGYSSTAEVFSKSVGHVFEEELASIRNRQKIQGLVLEGSLSEAIESTYQLFPGILERNANLLFALKIREFIEMVSSANKVRHDATPTTKGKYAKTADTSNGMLVDSHENQNGTTTTPKTNGNSAKAAVSEEDMELDSSDPLRPAVSSGDMIESGQTLPFLDFDYDNLQRILQFGRDLFQMNASIEDGENQTNKKMLRDAFSLLAYHDPWSSPLGYQLDPSQREHVSSLLNSAILEANNMPRISPLEVIYGQTNECMRLMSKYGVAWCAYVNLNDYMQS